MRIPVVISLGLLAATSIFAQATADDDSIANHQSPSANQGAQPEGSLSRVMDAYLRAYAADNIEWRYDVQLGKATESSVAPDGYQKSRADMGGWYLFRPKTSDMLTLDQRRAILRDPRFPQFLAQMRAAADGKLPALDPGLVAASKAKPAPEQPKSLGRAELMGKLLAGRRAPPDTVVFTLTAEELVMPGRVVITTNAILAP